MAHVRSWLVIACAMLAGCRQHGETATKEGAPAPDLQEGEIAIALGDCAPVTTPFVSGPEPQSFTLEALTAPATTLYATMTGGGDVSASFSAANDRTPKPSTGAFAASAPGVTGINPARLSQSYVPGTASPLQTLRIALLDCFRRQDRRYATAVFDLGPGALVAHGLDGAAFEKCITDLAPQVKTKAPVRCAVAFGSAPATSLPSIDITADAITLGGKQTSEVAAIMAGEPEPWWKIESVHTAASLRVRATLASKEPLTLHGPLVVRPLPTTPMNVVTKLVYTLIDAGEDPVLAAQRSGQWVLLRERSLPFVPVPLGTGGSWSSDKDRVRAARTPEDAARPTLSALVSPEGVWVGASNGIGGAWHADKDFVPELTRQKTSAAFADREDIEIAATGDVPYSRVVELIDSARAAGFTQWSLMAPRSLAAPPSNAP
jgi:hypothetical protein